METTYEWFSASLDKRQEKYWTEIKKSTYAAVIKSTTW